MLSVYLHCVKYSTFVTLFSSYNHPMRFPAIFIILQMRKLRFREVR